jgi:hypothetical protein
MSSAYVEHGQTARAQHDTPLPSAESKPRAVLQRRANSVHKDIESFAREGLVR